VALLQSPRMSSVIQPAEFFVVGGPVQPDRPCYVERDVDRRLLEALRAKRFCCVLGPLGLGKTSLLQRAARTLRAAGTLVATVDLRRIAERPTQSQDGWLLQVAERIAADLKLGVDVRSWWAARELADENPLVEFFWEIVLTNTTAPVVILVDDIDAVLELPFAGDLLDAIGACLARRAREPDFARLGFALAGCVSLRELAQAAPESGVGGADLLAPEDFTAEQSYRFAVAFGGDRELAQALMDRIRAWTSGQPYLTQRVARGVIRKGGRLEDVERLIREQLAAPEAANRDPLLASMRARLAEPSSSARRAAALVHRLAAGRTVAAPADAAVADRLWLSGAVTVGADGVLAIRNRIVKELVTDGWLKRRNGASKWLAAAAVLLLVIAAGGFWYTQRLPVADVATLTDPLSSVRAVETSYRRLRGLPGFEQRADELWLAALERQSVAATTLEAALAADMRLRELPGQSETADRLLADFWLRRARERAHLEQREAAILLAQRAAVLPAAAAGAGAYLAELVGDDYSRLERTLRLPSSPEHWHVSFADAALVAIDAERRAQRLPLAAAAASAATAVPLSALTHSALVRELAVQGEGTAGDFVLSLLVQHPAAAELLVTLTAPSGIAAVVAVPRSDGAAVETFSFQVAPGSPLAQLADEGVAGVWRLTVVDREAGNTGVLGGWGLTFGELVVRDDFAEVVTIADPVRGEDVAVRSVAELAVAWPVVPGVVGTLAVWDLAAGRLERDLTLPEPPRDVAIDPAGGYVLAATSRTLTVWNVADGALAARVGTETEFVLPPVFSADGGYVAIAERVEGANPLYSVLRTVDGSLVSTIDGLPDAESWELGPGGRYVAVRGPETVVRVLETRRGAELRRLPHTHAVERLMHSNDGAMLVTVDGAGTIASWPLALASEELGRPLGRTASATSVSASADGRRLAFTRDDGAVAVLDVIAGAELYRLRVARSLPVTATQLSADGTRLATQSGTNLKLWRVPVRPVTPRTATVDAWPTALALDRANDLVAVGLASGQLQILPAGAAAAPLAFFGHRGGVAAAALNASQGLAATGGADGIVRVWDLTSGTPTGAVAQPAAVPVTNVALSGDGRYVASAAGSVVRAASVADGRVLTELEAPGAVTALAFAPDGAALAVAAASGAVIVVPLADGARGRTTVQVAAAATSLAFSPEGSRLAVADAGGAVTLLAVSGELVGTARRWTQPVRWLAFSPDGGTLLVATDAWLHALAATPELEPTHSKLVVWPAAGTALTAVSSSVVGFAGVEIGGAVAAGVIDVAAAPSGPTDAALATRDWSSAFEVRLNDNGEPEPIRPTQ
jgi:WD40 repeat protein/subtilisin-like proprotein convertase family protein